MPYVRVAIALLAPLWFPWQLVLLVLLVIAQFEPIAAVAGGILADTLYFTHGAYPFPYMSFCALAIAGGTIFVRKFLEARILSRKLNENFLGT